MGDWSGGGRGSSQVPQDAPNAQRNEQSSFLGSRAPFEAHMWVGEGKGTYHIRKAKPRIAARTKKAKTPNDTSTATFSVESLCPAGGKKKRGLRQVEHPLPWDAQPGMPNPDHIRVQHQDSIEGRRKLPRSITKERRKRPGQSCTAHVPWEKRVERKKCSTLRGREEGPASPCSPQSSCMLL